VGLPLQQNRSCDRRDAARCHDLGDARSLSCRVPIRVLDPESSSRPARTLSPISTARLCALARIFTGGLADVLACVCWIALRRHPFGSIYICPDALAD